MEWDVIASTGEWAGAIAVVVTLVYLARQLRQSNKIGGAEAEREWFQNWHEIVWSFGVDEHIAEVMQRGINDFGALSQLEQAVFHVRVSGVVNQADCAKTMVDKGLLSEDLLDTNVRICGSLLNTTGGEQWWSDVGHVYRIHQYLEDRRKAVDVEPFDELSPFKLG
jgi:hypothetical protein